MSAIWEIIKSIGGIKKIIEMISSAIEAWKISRIQKEKEAESAAIAALKAAQTQEEREKAIEDIAKHL